MDFRGYKNIDGVHLISDLNPEFESAYTSVRKEEGRMLSIEEVQKLPFPDKSSKHYQEWQLRVITAERFAKYVEGQNNKSVLEIGCGNGWFTKFVYKAMINSNVVGIDVNLIELKQAVKAFGQSKLQFAYCDIFECESLFQEKFDYVIFNASIQYFQDFTGLISLVQSFVKPKGEIHILDSPFYKTLKIENAKKRSKLYYDSVGQSEMKDFYFHHSINELKGFKYLYKPKRRLLSKLLNIKDSPFPWLKIIKS
jgi:ubiquinone/menaquinone biosynthesis C-methylase UbiE